MKKKKNREYKKSDQLGLNKTTCEEFFVGTQNRE